MSQDKPSTPLTDVTTLLKTQIYIAEKEERDLLAILPQMYKISRCWRISTSKYQQGDQAHQNSQVLGFMSDTTSHYSAAITDVLQELILCRERLEHLRVVLDTAEKNLW